MAGTDVELEAMMVGMTWVPLWKATSQHLMLRAAWAALKTIEPLAEGIMAGYIWRWTLFDTFIRQKTPFAKACSHEVLSASLAIRL